MSAYHYFISVQEVIGDKSEWPSWARRSWFHKRKKQHERFQLWEFFYFNGCEPQLAADAVIASMGGTADRSARSQLNWLASHTDLVNSRYRHHRVYDIRLGRPN